MVAVTCYNLRTSKRHLLYTLSKRELCRCGCRGWCSLYAVFSHLAWGMKAATDGQRPAFTCVGQTWEPTSVYAALGGQKLTNRFVLVQLKADWAEYCHTVGFPTWQSYHVPCFMCSATRDDLFNFDDITAEETPWGSPRLSYEESCRKCEIVVCVTSDAVKQSILHDGGLHFDNRKNKAGKILAHDVPHLSLKAGDRLDPGYDIFDIALFEELEPPFTCVFWRKTLDATGKCTDRTLRRNPIFSSSLGTDPQQTCHLDTMHCIYIGVMHRLKGRHMSKTRGRPR